MNISTGVRGRVFYLPVAVSIVSLAAVLLAGCGTQQLYDTPRQPGQTSGYNSPRQNFSPPPPADNLSFSEPDSTSPNSNEIILHDGDVVKISVPGSPNLDATQQIRLDGKISLPLIGDVKAEGMTPSQLRDNLVKLYAPQISTSEINVEVASSTFPVYVTGCVLRPGKVLSDQPITAMEAIMEAGGFDYSRANLRHVHVIRHDDGSSQSYVEDLKTVLHGDAPDNFYLKPGDIIFVPEKFSWF